MLSRPQLGENIGFVVRLCANHAIDDLVLVRPREGWRTGAERTASMCKERLSQIRVCDSLADALHDQTMCFGLSARQGRERIPAPVEELGDAAAQEATGLALVFGNEESGLDRDETALCTHLFRIERPGLASLNLSHAVAVTLHEWARGRVSDRITEAPSTTTLGERQRIATRTRAILGELDFRTDDPHFDGALTRLVEGVALQKRDARVLDRVLRHLEWLHERRSI